MDSAAKGAIGSHSEGDHEGVATSPPEQKRLGWGTLKSESDARNTRLGHLPRRPFELAEAFQVSYELLSSPARERGADAPGAPPFAVFEGWGTRSSRLRDAPPCLERSRVNEGESKGLASFARRGNIKCPFFWPVTPGPGPLSPHGFWLTADG